MQPIIDAVAEDIYVLIPLSAMSIAIIGVVGGIVKSIVANKQYEKSRREIAAYIAEGSISPDEGEKLLSAKPQRRCS